MAIPTQEELEAKVQAVHAALQNMERLDASFRARWEALSDAEKKELARVREHIERADMHAILEKISSIKD